MFMVLQLLVFTDSEILKFYNKKLRCKKLCEFLMTSFLRILILSLLIFKTTDLINKLWCLQS